MNNELRDKFVGRYGACAAMLWVLLLTGCAQLRSPPVAPPEPVVAELPSAPVEKKADDALPSLDAVMVEHHHQCETSGNGNTYADGTPQLRDLMRWLERNCNISDTTLAPQRAALKQLRQRYTWPDAYAAWLDEWRRVLARMQVLQQRAATAEAAQATIVKRLRAIERDLTTRP